MFYTARIKNFRKFSDNCLKPFLIEVGFVIDWRDETLTQHSYLESDVAKKTVATRRYALCDDQWHRKQEYEEMAQWKRTDCSKKEQ